MKQKHSRTHFSDELTYPEYASLQFEDGPLRLLDGMLHPGDTMPEQKDANERQKDAALEPGYATFHLLIGNLQLKGGMLRV